MTFTKPITEIIQRRVSCRTYQKEPISGETRQLLADNVTSMHTGPLGGPARFALVAGSDASLKELKGLGTYGFIKGATGFIVGATPADTEHLEDFGYLLETIILHATDLGLGTCWLGGTFTKTSFAKKIAARTDELVPSVASVGYIAKKPRRVDALIRKGAKSDNRKPWESLFFDGNFETPLERPTAGEYATALEMLRLGPSASNKQPWRVVRAGDRWHFYLKRTPKYRERRLNRATTVADLQRIDMGIAMCHFGLTAHEIGLLGDWIVDEPADIQPDKFCEYAASWVGSNN
ncbi:MAG: nitroreductase family protein [Anaerolineales bacterium]|jgi:nitroreductase